MELTIEQIKNMKHAIGYEVREIKRGKYTAYRNYYSTPGNDKGWDNLVKKGLAERREGNGACQVYRVTQEGIRVLEEILGYRIVEE